MNDYTKGILTGGSLILCFFMFVSAKSQMKHLGEIVVDSIVVQDAPKMEWANGFGNDIGNHVHQGMQTSDGGYIGVGNSSVNTNNSNMLIVKTDAQGQLEWQKFIGSKRSDETVATVCEDAQGHFYIGGSMQVNREQESAIIKLSAEGEIIWKRIYPHPRADAIEGITLTSDGHLLATGYSNSAVHGAVFLAMDGKGFLLKLDLAGNVIWETILESIPQGMMAYEHPEGYAVGGTILKNLNAEEEWVENHDYCMVVTDPNGKELWSRNFGGPKSEHCYDFARTSNGGYVFAGHTRSYGVINWDYLLMKVDAEGNEAWHSIFGQPRGYDPRYIHDEAYGVKETSDGGFAIIGGSGDEHPYSAAGHAMGPSDLWLAYLVKTDSLGNKEWESVYGERSGHNAGEYMDVTDDGGFIIFSDSDTYGTMKNNSFGFIKLK